MAQEALQTGGQPQAEAIQFDDFSALLQKEFKPQDDKKADRISQAVQTLAQQALSDAAVIGNDVFSTVDAMVAVASLLLELWVLPCRISLVVIVGML